jgi:hypothetical protein
MENIVLPQGSDDTMGKGQDHHLLVFLAWLYTNYYYANAMNDLSLYVFNYWWHLTWESCKFSHHAQVPFDH